MKTSRKCRLGILISLQALLLCVTSMSRPDVQLVVKRRKTARDIVSAYIIWCRYTARLDEGKFEGRGSTIDIKKHCVIILIRQKRGVQ